MRQYHFIIWILLFSVIFGSGCRNDDSFIVVERYNFEDGTLRLQKLKSRNFSGFCYQSYYSNGGIEAFCCTDSLGRKVGKNCLYYKNGQLKQEQYYRNGVLQGIDREYFPSGKIKSDFYYENGNLNGISRDFNESGVLKGKRIFVEDQNIFHMRYDLEGDSTLWIKPYVAAPDTVFINEKFDVQFSLPTFGEIEFEGDTHGLIIEFDVTLWARTSEGTRFPKPRFREKIDSLPFTIEETAIKEGDLVIYGNLSNFSGWKQKNVQSGTFIKRFTAKKKVTSKSI